MDPLFCALQVTLILDVELKIGEFGVIKDFTDALVQPFESIIVIV